MANWAFGWYVGILESQSVNFLWFDVWWMPTSMTGNASNNAFEPPGCMKERAPWIGYTEPTMERWTRFSLFFISFPEQQKIDTTGVFHLMWRV